MGSQHSVLTCSVSTGILSEGQNDPLPRKLRVRQVKLRNTALSVNLDGLLFSVRHISKHIFSLGAM